MAATLGNLGMIARAQGDYAGAEHDFDRALQVFREIRYPRGESYALNNLGTTLLMQGRYARAQACYEDSLHLKRAAGAHWLLGFDPSTGPRRRWLTALLLGVIVAPTDPVSVLATFRAARGDRELTTIVESESLFNDGIAVVLYGVLLSALDGATLDPVQGIGSFVLRLRAAPRPARRRPAIHRRRHRRTDGGPRTDGLRARSTG